MCNWKGNKQNVEEGKGSEWTGKTQGRTGPCAVRWSCGALPTSSPALSSQARPTLTGTALAAVNHWQHHWLCVAIGAKEVQDPHGAVWIQSVATAVTLALQVGFLGKKG